jgi:Ran GTPase-activating protein (RanGAP) involved in mRNA processing and transport
MSNAEKFWKVFDILVLSYLNHNKGTVAVVKTFCEKKTTEIVDFVLKCEEIKENCVQVEITEDRFWEEVRKKEGEDDEK